ncbi:unnamed protein product [Dovyalis caffra]|uniref:CUE domain-containing protein n=1 Tax=Dovyalis caffra TaxID=77055 RepID=A0AAV1SPB2_9ROSI|nr:unnamed protein product [Dovyalis caffra]
MKPGGASALNPYAASYIPLSKRDSADGIEIPGWTMRSGNQNVWYGSADHNAQIMQNDKGPICVPEVSTPKSQSRYGFYGSSSQNLNEVTGKQTVDEEFEMYLDYLRINFPGMSDESLTDVFMASRGDLETAVDMLNQLEFDILESSGNLPDTLDIGDVYESGPSAESSSVKLKTVVGEASASSGSSAVDTVSSGSMLWCKDHLDVEMGLGFHVKLEYERAGRLVMEWKIDYARFPINGKRITDAKRRIAVNYSCEGVHFLDQYLTREVN